MNTTKFFYPTFSICLHKSYSGTLRHFYGRTPIYLKSHHTKLSSQNQDNSSRFSAPCREERQKVRGRDLSILVVRLRSPLTRGGLFWAAMWGCRYRCHSSKNRFLVSRFWLKILSTPPAAPERCHPPEFKKGV